MIKYSKNILYKADIPIRQSKEIYDEWYAYISDLIYGYLKNEEISFLSTYSPNKSIGDDFCRNHIKIKTYKNTYYYYTSACLSKENISLLVNDSEFYLGNIILIKGAYKVEVAYLIALCWEKELITSDKEIFKVDNDGYSLYCYNIVNKTFEDSFKIFLDKLGLMLNV